jgi:acyl carrier protein
MSMSGEVEVKTALRKWLLDNGKVAAEALRDDTQLLEAGVLDSLQLIQLVRYIEKLRKKSLPFDSIGLGAFRSIQSIYKNCF